MPESEATLTGAALYGNQLVLRYLDKAVSTVRVASLDGARAGQVKLPEPGSVEGFSGNRSDAQGYFLFSSFLRPPQIYRLDPDGGTVAPAWQVRAAVNSDRYETRQIFYASKDGTRIPMFLIHRRGLRPDGKTPVLLTGYGGFSIPFTPEYSPKLIAWLDLGGMVAVPNLRGGGEFGEQWHLAGIKTHKQNVFDDFIAAAGWLVAQHYTVPGRIAIAGGSNGGLLVAACMLQRPELFGVALPDVGVHDMLRFHQFTGGHDWIDDYGSVDDPAEFAALRAYSPVHNTHPGTHDPATLITTADHDDRVVPGHSFKLTAALQHDQGGPAPVLIRIETRAGHGGGKPTAKQIDLAADQLAFALHQMHVPVP